VHSGFRPATRPSGGRLDEPSSREEVATEVDYKGYLLRFWGEDASTAGGMKRTVICWGTLVTRYGKGVYIFTAFSWFRELPAGVPGAYRIFANFLSASKTLQTPVGEQAVHTTASSQ